MDIRIQKGGGANPDALTCTRVDGTVMQYDLPPNAAYHDLAHFVVETELGIGEGFWGMIAKGFHVSEYNKSNEERPFQISAAGYRAEFLATMLQSAVYTGAISSEYLQILRESAEANNLPFPEMPPQTLLNEMIRTLQELTTRWTSLQPGGCLQLSFEETPGINAER